jgi:hypothetical protein
MLGSKDPTWTISGAMYWSVIETNIGILAASIPSFKAFAKRFLPRILGEDSSKRNTTEPGSIATGETMQDSSNGNAAAVELKSSAMQSEGDESWYQDMDIGKGMKTTIEKDTASEESQYRSTIPVGKIATRTQISTYVEASRN